MDSLWTSAVIWISLLAALPDLALCSRNSYFLRQPSLDDRVFEENLLWETTTASTLGCAEGCATDEKCAAFTSMKVTSLRRTTCRGHSQAVTSGGKVSPYTRLYKVDRPTIPEILPWLGTTCGDDSDSDESDCVRPNSECFESKCLCTPGYYYSNSKRTCNPDCADLQSTFVKYPNWYISLKNINESATTLDECQKWCTSLDTCVSFEYSTGRSTCYLSAITVLDLEDKTRWKQSTESFAVSYWQRTCV